MQRQLPEEPSYMYARPIMDVVTKFHFSNVCLEKISNVGISVCSVFVHVRRTHPLCGWSASLIPRHGHDTEPSSRGLAINFYAFGGIEDGGGLFFSRDD